LRGALLVACWAAGVLGCSGGSGKSPAGSVTFYEDVAPILDAQCVGCHRSGGIAPFSLTDYPSAKVQATAIAKATAAREMPPMPVDGSGICNTYANARWLTSAQIGTLASWAAAGAPEGDPQKAPPAPSPPAGLGTPDAVVDIGGSYMPNAAMADDYRCFVAQSPVLQASMLAAFEVVPGDPRVVHHVIAYQPNDDSAAAAARARDEAEDGLGYTCFGGPGVEAAPVALWAPGAGAVVLPAGTGISLAAGRPWIIQIHYNLAQGAFPDRSHVNLRLTHESVRAAVFAPVADQNLQLPPGRASVEQTFIGRQDPAKPYTIYGAAPHMHTLGRTMRVDVTTDQGPTCLVNVDRWDFHWQNVWWYDQPLHIESPQSLSIRCGYDTTGRTSPVTWGEGTADEMCISYFYLVPDVPKAPPPAACTGTGNPLFGSCVDDFLTGCYQPDRSGTCTSEAGVIRWSDGSTYVQPQPNAAAAPGFYRPGDAAPCVGLVSDSSGNTLTKATAMITYVGSGGTASITCPDGSHLSVTGAQVAEFNTCRGITCP